MESTAGLVYTLCVPVRRVDINNSHKQARHKHDEPDNTKPNHAITA